MPEDATAERIRYENGRLIVPDHPIIPFIEGDGTGPDIWRASQPVFDAAVRVAYGGQRSIMWRQVLAGEAAFKATGEWLPKQTLDAFREFLVGIKGPLTTPIGGGIRSLNVALRQDLDLYACVRPVFHVPGVPAPVKHPEEMDIVLFRENTEDVYSGVEFEAGTDAANRLRRFLVDELGVKPSKIREGAALGLKPISEFGAKRLVRKALQYAIDNKRPSVTIVHKGNIMKFTEGGFLKWGYEVATKEFRDAVVTWEEVQRDFGGKIPPGKILVQDIIADNMFQQLLTRTSQYSVLATTNLNGDYLSDAAAGQIGGLGIAPGGNIGDGFAVFEATHGTAPKYAGQDKVNPGSVILSGVMMLDYMGWKEAAALVRESFAKVVESKVVTYDLAREIPGVNPVKASEFGEAIVATIEGKSLAPWKKAAASKGKARAPTKKRTPRVGHAKAMTPKARKAVRKTAPRRASAPQRRRA
ncbi:MAG: isocitrate dehydrogenase (NADP(+)) [Thermoplasmatota archaeon]